MYASGYCSSWERSCSTAVQLVSGFFHERLRLCSRARFLAAPSSAYLDSDGAPHEGDQPLMISASRSNPLAVPSFAKAGFLFRRLSIKR